MTDGTDIIGRLKNVSKDHDMPPSWQSMKNIRTQDTCDAAADEITRLRAENERLRALIPKPITKPVAPPKWKVGMLVEYISNSEWAWGEGTRGRIVELSGDCADRKGDEYQVFWVCPLNTSGVRWWTTPSDVRYIKEKVDD